MRQHRRSCLDGPRSPALRRAPRNVQRRSTTQETEVSAPLPEDAVALKTLSLSLPIRLPLVQRIRAELEQGTYMTARKWESALDSLVRRLAGD